ncbi:HEAT repeat domain-containing protein [Halotia branconii]|uniref:HEAT repeat domain-containing protein n=1 Tax=Halotia branconii CENA392 TaxID=1539056 RepID=A0AAJ6NWQ4_9CYAN|nr:HEAT repeat domain-containing protein [Halotia branconii]WGV27893.1 HEAT repeat domain-containing protein [Halotia branconii CENA392]
MQKLLEQLDNIFEVIEKEDIAPPISDEKFRRLAGRLPFKIPSIIENLYKWHDGIEQFIPGYDLLPLSDAIAEYENLIALGEEYQDKEFFDESFFPILYADKSYILVDCDPSYEASIYCLFLELNDILQRYENVDQMLQIVVDAYLSRAYYMEEGLLVKNPVLLQKIESKYLSLEQQNQREAEWNKLCDELHQLENRDRSQEQWDFQKSILISRLYETYDERAIIYLTKFLNDNNPQIVSKAAFGLGELRAREKVPELIKLLNHPAQVVRNLAACAIREIASPEDELLIQPLLTLLADEAHIVQISAAEALGRLKNPKAVATLINFFINSLSDNKSGVKYQIISALKQIGDFEVVEKLKQQKSKVPPHQVQLIDEAISLIEKANW